MLPEILSYVFAVSLVSYATAAQTQHANFFRSAILLALACLTLVIAPSFISICHSVLGVQALTCIFFCMAVKLAALAMNRGALAKELAAGCGLWHYCGVLVLPVIPCKTGQLLSKNAAASVVVKLQSALFKLTIFALLTAVGMVASVHITPHLEQPKSPRFLLLLTRIFMAYSSGVALWLEVDGMGDFVDAIALGFFGIEAEPHFRAPFLTPSVNEYWGKRWNVTVSSLLRQVVFHPICDRSFYARSDGHLCQTSSNSKLSDVQLHEAHAASNAKPHAAGTLSMDAAPMAAEPATADASSETRSSNEASSDLTRDSGTSTATSSSETSGSASDYSAPGGRRHSSRCSKMRKLVASMCTFAASGVWHELVFAQMTGWFTTHGVWTTMFVIQAPLIALESYIHKWMNKRGLKVPRWVAVIVANIVVSSQIAMFWIPPLLWKLPNTCPGSPPSTSLLETIQLQGARDLESVTRFVTAIVSALRTHTLTTERGLGDVMTWLQGTLAGTSN